MSWFRKDRPAPSRNVSTRDEDAAFQAIHRAPGSVATWEVGEDVTGGPLHVMLVRLHPEGEEQVRRIVRE